MNDYIIVTRVTAPSLELAEKVASEMAQGLEDARDSGELPAGVTFSVDDADLVSGERHGILVALAQKHHAIGSDDNIEVYDNARVSNAGDDGAWVEAWVYLGKDELAEAGITNEEEGHAND